MKVTVLPLFVAALGLVSEVSASPLRIYILGTGENPSAVVAGNAAQPVPIEGSVMPMRWGHAAAGSQQVPRPLMMAESSEGSDDEKDGDDKHKHMGFHGIGRGRGRMMKGGCGRHGLRGKALALQNWLRTKFGMEPIAPHPHFRRPHHHFHHHHEHEEGVPVPETVEGEENAPDSLKVLPFPMHTSEQDGEVQAPHHHGHHFHHFRRPHSFSGRLSKALMTLGPWEGRVVAFVIGCGIGALLRMFYVLVVLATRSVSRRREDDDVQEITVLFDHVEAPLPRYTDEKLPIVEEEHRA